MSALSFRKFLVRAAVLGAAGAFLNQGTSAVLLKMKRADEPSSIENFIATGGFGWLRETWLRESDKKTFTILASQIRDLKAMPNSRPEDLVDCSSRGTEDALGLVYEAQSAIYEMRFDHRIVHAGHSSGLGNIKFAFNKNPFELFKAFQPSGVYVLSPLENWLQKDASKKIPKDTIAYLEKVAELGKLVQDLRAHQRNAELDKLDSELAKLLGTEEGLRTSFPIEKGSGEAVFFNHLFKQYARVETTEDSACDIADGSLDNFKSNMENALHVAKDFYTEYALGSHVGEYDFGSGNLSAFRRLYAQDAGAGFPDKFGADKEITEIYDQDYTNSKERLMNSRAKHLDQQVRPLLRENAKIFELISNIIQHMPKLSDDDLVKMGFPCSASFSVFGFERVFEDDALNHILFMADKYASVFYDDSDTVPEATKKYFTSLRHLYELVTAIRSNMKEAADIQRFSYLQSAKKALLDFKKAEKMVEAMLANEGRAKKGGSKLRAFTFSRLLTEHFAFSTNFASALPQIEKMIISYDQHRPHRADPESPTHKPIKMTGKSQKPAEKTEDPAKKAEKPVKQLQKPVGEDEDNADDDDGNSDSKEEPCYCCAA